MKSSPSSASKPSNESDFSGERLRSTIFGCLNINARTAHYRRCYLFQMICFPFIPILALFVQNLSIFLEQIRAYNETMSVNQQVSVAYRLCKQILTKNLFCVKIDFLNGKCCKISSQDKIVNFSFNKRWMYLNFWVPFSKSASQRFSFCYRVKKSEYQRLPFNNYKCSLLRAFGWLWIYFELP